MKKLCLIAVLFCCWPGTDTGSAEEIDRLLAAVNGRVITEGDFKMARPLNALLSLGRSDSSATRQEELLRLIELELLRQELENFQLDQGDQSRIQADLEARMNDLKEAYAEIGGLPALLRQLGLQEGELIAYVKLQVLMERFIDMRFRIFVPAPTRDEEQAYYQQKVLPLAKAGTPPPPLSEAAGKIDAILIEEKVNTAYAQWIGNIRSHSRIEFFSVSARASGEKRP